MRVTGNKLYTTAGVLVAYYNADTYTVFVSADIDEICADNAAHLIDACTTWTMHAPSTWSIINMDPSFFLEIIEHTNQD